jgi:hypothetical protein
LFRGFSHAIEGEVGWPGRVRIGPGDAAIGAGGR